MPYIFRGKTFDEFELGKVYTTVSRTITEADVVAFAGVSGDFNPLHTDEEYAKTTPLAGRVAHGPLVLSIASGQANQLGIFEGTTLALLSMTTRFVSPVRFGDTIHTELTVTEKKESKKPDRGIANFAVAVLNQNGEKVIEGEWVVMLVRRVLEVS
ncbi:MAG: MaoC/PaaZ C-terminal domain-containing protein [Thermodesulfobacteriota bacterium]